MLMTFHNLKRNGLCRGSTHAASHSLRLGTDVVRIRMNASGGRVTSHFCMKCARELLDANESVLKKLKEY